MTPADLAAFRALALAATEGVTDDGYRLRAPDGELIVEYKHSLHPNAENDGALFTRARPMVLALLDHIADMEMQRERDTTPPTREEITAHEAHGGFWLVSRVENARPGEPAQARPRLFRLSMHGDRFVGSSDCGAFFDDPDLPTFMPNAVWTPLTRDGAPMARGPR